MAPSPEYPDLQLVRPRWWNTGRASTEYGHGVQYLVVHYTAGAERSTSAEDGAAYDQRRDDKVSTHYFVDSNSVVQCVLTPDTAYAAFFYGNAFGIQYELCGTVQTREQWLDPASDATITNAARQMARDCQRYGLPVRRLTPTQMRAGAKGICGHVDVTNAYGRGDHTDPGTQFPWDVLLARVAQFLSPQSPQEEDDMDSLERAWLSNDMEYSRSVHQWTDETLGTISDDFAGTVDQKQPNKFKQAFAALAADVAELKSRPQVQPAPIDPASLVAALLHPDVQALLVAAAEQGANAAEDS